MMVTATISTALQIAKTTPSIQLTLLAIEEVVVGVGSTAIVTIVIVIEARNNKDRTERLRS